jgi:hypothetical protein
MDPFASDKRRVFVRRALLVVGAMFAVALVIWLLLAGTNKPPPEEGARMAPTRGAVVAVATGFRPVSGC